MYAKILMYSCIFLIEWMMHPVYGLTLQDYQAFKGKDLSSMSTDELTRICNHAAPKINHHGTDYKPSAHEDGCTLNLVGGSASEKLVLCGGGGGSFFIGKGQSVFGVYEYSCKITYSENPPSLLCGCTPMTNIPGPL